MPQGVLVLWVEGMTRSTGRSRRGDVPSRGALSRQGGLCLAAMSLAAGGGPIVGRRRRSGCLVAGDGNGSHQMKM
jgi:hypothetical protein